MKNEKEFDYDKKKPKLDEIKVIKVIEMKKEKTEDLT